MQAVAETITEHYIMEGKREGRREGLVEGERKGLMEGKREGLIEGERKGEILGQLKALKSLSDDGVIDATVYESRSRVLRKQLKALKISLD